VNARGLQRSNSERRDNAFRKIATANGLRDSNLNRRSLFRKLYALGTFKCAKHSFSDKRKS